MIFFSIKGAKIKSPGAHFIDIQGQIKIVLSQSDKLEFRVLYSLSVGRSVACLIGRYLNIQKNMG